MTFLSAFAAVLVAAAPPAPQRFAVVVGANGAAPGRAPLHFAYRDAEEMADVLVRAGEIPRAQVTVLRDPEPDQVLAALDGRLLQAAVAPGGALLVFYYSGHADTESLFPNGKALPLAAVRERLENRAATVRLGIVDACRGGGWTRAKGADLAPAARAGSLDLSSEGSVLMSSSSGLESAHESESLAGSFFTHHLVAGLRGAADRNGDGEVTASEAFSYAQELTVRDSSLRAPAPQHPSFQTNLRGRTDLPLARVAASETRLELRQEFGPLQLIQLANGLTVLELPAGRREARVAVAPGRYLVRRRAFDGVRAREIAVEPGRPALVFEESLPLVSAPPLTLKAALPPRPPSTTLEAGAFQISGAVRSPRGAWSSPQELRTRGLSYDQDWSASLGLVAGVSDRLEWAFPLILAYRLGEPDGLELIPWGGVTQVADVTQTFAKTSRWLYGLGAGMGLRRALAERITWNMSLEVRAGGALQGGARASPDGWRGIAGAGVSWTVVPSLTLHPGLQWATGASGSANPFGDAQTAPTEAASAIGLGAVGWSGTSARPLVQLQLVSGFSVDLDAGIWWSLSGQERRASTSLTVGATWIL